MNILDFIFPKNCLNCKKEGAYICVTCLNKVTKPKIVCPECQKASIDGFTHIRCQKKFGINGLISVWNYEGVVRKAILALKYKYTKEIVYELTSYALPLIKQNPIINILNSYVLVPIPLHWYKENYRGFNQSEELGKQFAIDMKWNFIPDLLIKKKITVPQVGLKGKERLANVKKVFSLNTKYKILNTGFILFDDVYTTGSTLKEAAKVLKRSGANKVWGLTIAR